MFTIFMKYNGKRRSTIPSIYKDEWKKVSKAASEKEAGFKINWMRKRFRDFEFKFE